MTAKRFEIFLENYGAGMPALIGDWCMLITVSMLISFIRM